MNDNLYYFITTECNCCGQCTELCEQKAISPGTPYTISSDKCNACGNCVAVCSAEAIIPENDPYRLINREADSFFGGGVWMIGRKWWESDTPNQ